jgi:hypothetical protein
MIKNYREDHEVLKRAVEVDKTTKSVQAKLEAQSISCLRTPVNPQASHTKITPK